LYSKTKKTKTDVMDKQAAESAQPAALFVDFDNIWFGLQGIGIKGITPKTIARSLIELARRAGSLEVARVYATVPRRTAGMHETFVKHGYEVIAAEDARKNTDIQMALDCQELLFTRPEIKAYLIVSGDSDFERLARAITLQGKRVIVVAPTAVASSLLIERADTFLPLENFLSGTPDESALRETRTQAIGQVHSRPAKVNRREAPEAPALRVFLCHSRHDKPRVIELYRSLKQQPGIQPWLDKEDLLPGQDWALEIEKAVKRTHCVIVCLSKRAMDSAGYLHKEIKFALDVADQQPEGTSFLIPVKLEECEAPERLRRYHWVDLFEPDGYGYLLQGLRARANAL
jgi:hypothetical protein